MAAETEVENAVTGPRALLLTVALAVLTASPAQAALRVLVVSGLGGETEYERRFQQQAESVALAATKAGASPENVVMLSGEKARREELMRELTALGTKAQKDDQVAVVFIGHGSYDESDYRFNVPGPDITGREILAKLDRIAAAQQLVVLATSSSGAVIETWKRPNRILITATKSGGERTATRFAQYWVEALSSTEADRDKNEVITAAEAYELAARKVADTFKSDAALATEHSRLEGNAARFVVARLGAPSSLPDDPALAALTKEQTGLEQQIEQIKGRKATLDSDRYYDELEKVLIEMARLDRRIDERKATLSGTHPRGIDARPGT